MTTILTSHLLCRPPWAREQPLNLHGQDQGERNRLHCHYDICIPQFEWQSEPWKLNENERFVCQASLQAETADSATDLLQLSGTRSWRTVAFDWAHEQADNLQLLEKVMVNILQVFVFFYFSEKATSHLSVLMKLTLIHESCLVQWHTKHEWCCYRVSFNVCYIKLYIYGSL